MQIPFTKVSGPRAVTCFLLFLYTTSEIINIITNKYLDSKASRVVCVSRYTDQVQAVRVRDQIQSPSACRLSNTEYTITDDDHHLSLKRALLILRCLQDAPAYNY